MIIEFWEGHHFLMSWVDGDMEKVADELEGLGGVDAEIKLRNKLIPRYLRSGWFGDFRDSQCGSLDFRARSVLGRLCEMYVIVNNHPRGYFKVR